MSDELLLTCQLGSGGYITAPLKMRRDKWNELANQIAATCEDYTLVLSDEIHQLLASLYSEDEVIVAKRVELGKFLAYSAVRSGRQYIFMSKIEGWPEDAVAFVLANHGLDAYKIFVDPYTISVYDRTVVPPKRVARLGCAVTGAKLGLGIDARFALELLTVQPPPQIVSASR